MEIEPPTEQHDGWKSMGRIQKLIPLLGGFFLGTELAKEIPKDVENGQLKEELKRQIGLAIEQLCIGNRAGASIILDDAFSAAFEESLDPTTIIKGEAEAATLLLTQCLPRDDVALQDLYDCERLSKRPLPHFREAIYLLMLTASEDGAEIPKKQKNEAGRRLFSYPMEERSIILHLMGLRRKDIRQQLNFADSGHDVSLLEVPSEEKH